MPRTQPQQFFSADYRAVARNEGIEWEELPSLADSLAQRLVNFDPSRRIAPGSTVSEFELRFGTSWENTMPASLDSQMPPDPFRETLHGLVTREVREPEVFEFLFGPWANHS